MTNPLSNEIPGTSLDADCPSPSHQRRENILRAAVSVIAKHGYSNTTVTQIARAAGIPRTSFYNAYTNKQDVLNALLADASSRILITVEAACSPSDDWTERVYLSLRESLRLFASEPQLARVTFIDVQSAGPTVLASLHDHIRRYVYRLSPIHDHTAISPQPSDHLITQTIGAVYFAIYEALSAAGSVSLTELLPELTEIALIPHIERRQLDALLRAHRR